MIYTFNSYHGGGTHEATLPYDGAKLLEVPGAICANAACDAGEKGTLLRVAGVKGSGTRNHDGYECEVGCLKCGATIGRVVTLADTIFGVEEDANVGSRCRVY
jgi:hypothetical protein